MSLSDKKIQFNELEDQYFVNSENDLEVENILKLLNENICSFKDIVDKYKNTKDSDNDPCLYILLKNKDLFKELIENDRLTNEDLRYLFDKIDNRHELTALNNNTFLLQYIVDNVSFQELVDKYKSIQDKNNNPYLYRLLENKDLFKGLIENNTLAVEDLKYMLNRADTVYELDNLSENTILLKHIIENKIVSFQELIDKYKSIPSLLSNSCLRYLLNNTNLIEDLIESNLLTNADLKELIDKINTGSELDSLCWSTPTMKKILNDFLLNKETVNKFNKIFEKDLSDWYKHNQIQNIFELLKKRYEDKFWCELHNKKIDNELLKLIDLNKNTYKFDLDSSQKLELIEMLKDNEIAQNRFKEIVENNLENAFDFESLKVHLIKIEKKNLINI